jgi:hypothetical protein
LRLTTLSAEEPVRRIVSLSVIAVAALGSPPAAPFAQSSGTPPVPPCSAAEHRHFDFWIGVWTVTLSDGRTAGANRITSILNGCVLLEEWTGAGGGEGKSFNLYDAQRKQWRQTWVDGQGGILELQGGLNDAGEMVLVGEQPVRNGSGTARNRITWTPKGRDEVRQHWEVSTDGGTTWRSLFDGTYRRSP